ncbi:MAG: ATP-dependent zinc protease [Pseudomonadota bacterium]
MLTWRRIPILLIMATITGCAHFYPEPIEDDVQVLQTQLARQQEQMASQQVLLNSLLTQQNDTAAQQGQGFANLQDQMSRLYRITQVYGGSNEGESDDDLCPMAVPNLQDEARECTDRSISGAVESVHIEPPGHLFEARIDTGATTSSLDARSIEVFERDGEDYVRFELAGEHFENGESRELEQPVARFAEIVQASDEENERRPVVELQYRLGPVERVAEFTLTDRGHLTYPALIGRNVLRDLFVVDVGKTFHLSDREELRDAAGEVEAEE